MNVEIVAEAALFPEKEYIYGIFFAVRWTLWVYKAHSHNDWNFAHYDSKESKESVKFLSFSLYAGVIRAKNSAY